MNEKLTRYVVSVLALDRIGIIKSITAAIADLGGNIDGMSQTVVHGYFTVILTATFDRACEKDAVREAILTNFEPNEVSVAVRDFTAAPVNAKRETERYILTLSGNDRPGILKTVAAYLADNGINIEDYYFTIQDGKVTHISELTVPAEYDIKCLQGELQTLVSSIDLVSTLKHENLFRAANEIFAIRHLFDVHSCEK